jgi:hypothetical protein
MSAEHTGGRRRWLEKGLSGAICTITKVTVRAMKLKESGHNPIFGRFGRIDRSEVPSKGWGCAGTIRRR